MSQTMTWVGLDVHARSTHAAAISTRTGELTRARFGPGVDEPVAWLAGLEGPVRACYEAGPTGYGLYRAAAAEGIAVQVIAPGKTPRGPSERVKTDKKDAELLARLLLAGSLTAVVVPAPEVEAARDLMRVHDACRRDLMTARHRVSKLALRHGCVYPESSTPTQRHRAWLSSQQFSEAATELAFADALAQVDGLERAQGRVGRAPLRVRARRALVAPSRPTARLSRHRHADRPCASPRARRRLEALRARPGAGRMAGADAVVRPVRGSSRQGSITKTGSALARRLLVESAWHYRREPRIGATLENRQQGWPAQVLQISNRAQQRLYRVHRRMRSRGKPANVAAVACARELSCFLWPAVNAD